MTIAKLHKELQKLIDKGRGRLPVSVDIDSLWTGNGTFNIADIESVSVMTVGIGDGDGFQIENRDGSERTRASFVLSGEKTRRPA